MHAQRPYAAWNEALGELAIPEIVITPL